jgi:hypothetical protein
MRHNGHRRCRTGNVAGIADTRDRMELQELAGNALKLLKRFADYRRDRAPDDSSTYG